MNKQVVLKTKLQVVDNAYNEGLYTYKEYLNKLLSIILSELE
jgi:hypothetical protein